MNAIVVTSKDDTSLTTTAIGEANPIAAMLQAVVQNGITPENASALEKMTDLYMKIESSNARKSFAAAKSALQSELPRVIATKAIPGRDGTIRSTFAPYEEIMEQVQPYLTKHGFSVSFTMRVDDKRMCAVCTLTHKDGHYESNEFAVRIGSGPPGCSEAQSDGSARSYARRGALCDCLNVVIDHDGDARQEGGFITTDQVKELRQMVTATGSDEAKFLAYAGAESFETIRDGKFSMVHKTLTDKMRVINAKK